MDEKIKAGLSSAPDTINRDSLVTRIGNVESADTTQQADVNLEKSSNAVPDTSSIPYSVFSHRMKVAICVIATCSGLFSPLAINIYFPSITQIAQDLNVSVEKINITVTTFMIMQGIAPSFWGTLADSAGRRPVYVSTLLLFVFANIALALQDSYAGLAVLRMIQAAGSSSTIALGAATIADVIGPSERGSYMGFFSSGVMVAPAIAPVIGGLLSQTKDSWRASFWFLFGAGGMLLIVLFVWLPETGRQIVGNGSIKPTGMNRSLIEIFQQSSRNSETINNDLAPSRRKKLGNPLRCLALIGQIHIFLILIVNALIYTAFYCVTVGFSSQLKIVYNLDTLKIGLCFLPYGIGCSVGSIVTGKVLDYEFRRVAKKYGFQDVGAIRSDPEFKIEEARLSIAPPMIVIVSLLIAGYGWVFRQEISLAVPLIFLFFIGLFVTGVLTFVQVILVDLCSDETASVTASNNLVRCLMGAGGSALIETVIRHIGSGWAYVIVAFMTLLSAPIIFVELKFGQQWRKKRHEKQQARTAEAKLINPEVDQIDIERTGDEKDKQ
ncbi:major facilitator superfamily domain-containing protein [Lipomyces japonicus]|uniref:major facilitator superfamily domain-containing protein n=1 Tax=Lipomyces japonicus TaxID=56871 RepID=UPI0034CF224E